MGMDYTQHLDAIHPEHKKQKANGKGGSAVAVASPAAIGSNGHGTTLVATAPMVDVAHPRLTSEPMIWQTFGPAPTGLPANVAHIFPPRLILMALRREWRMKAIVAVASLGFGWLATYGLDMMSASVAMIAPLIYFLAAFFLLAVVGPRWTTRTVFVVLKERARTNYDMQKWWRRDEALWPDTWRRDFDRDSDWLKGQRVLMIDAQEWTPDDATELKNILTKKKEETVVTKRDRLRVEWRRIKQVPVWFVIGRREVITSKTRMVPMGSLNDEARAADRKRVHELLSKIYPYMPDKLAAPIQRPEGLDKKIPFFDHSMADIGEIWTIGHDIRILAGSHTLRKSKIKQMWIMIGIGACMAGIVVFSFLTIQGINGREKLRLQAQAQAAAQNQIKAELQKQLQEAGIITPPGPIIPADLIPNK